MYSGGNSRLLFVKTLLCFHVLMKYLSRLHPFFFILASLVFLYPRAAIIASPEQAIRPLLALWAGLALLAFLFNWFLRSWEWTAVLLSIAVLGICASASFFLAASVASVLVLGLWFLAATLRKRRMTLTQANGLLTLVALLLAVIMMTPLARQIFSIPAYVQHPSPLAGLQPASPSPDIYYIVLDGYGRADVLSDLYGFDNFEFLDFLEEKGFFVPSHSRSNYAKTALSVASTLNMDYIQSLAPGLEEQPFWWLMSPLVEQSRVKTSLEALGYQTISIATDWGITDDPKVGRYYAPRAVMLNDFEFFLLGATPLGAIKPALAKVVFVPSFDSHGELTRFNFETLARLPSMPGPKFVFAHVLAPHPPFVFDAEGNPLRPDYPFSFNDANDFPYDAETYRSGYLGQVQFVNSQIRALIETLLRESETPPIILLQADHGPGMFTDFESAENTCLRERFAAFAAYYLPGAASPIVPKDITPVNLFRIVFNQYFSANLPTLENRHYYSDGIHLYRQHGVTEIVDTCTLP